MYLKSFSSPMIKVHSWVNLSVLLTNIYIHFLQISCIFSTQPDQQSSRSKMPYSPLPSCKALQFTVIFKHFNYSEFIYIWCPFVAIWAMKAVTTGSLFSPFFFCKNTFYLSLDYEYPVISITSGCFGTPMMYWLLLIPYQSIVILKTVWWI